MKVINEAGRRLMVRGLIDIHTHVIPEVDDGVQTVADSNEMFRRYLEAGFRTVVATPHLSLAADAVYRKQLLEGFLDSAKRASRLGIELLDGKEIRLTPEINESTTDLKNVGLADTAYVLVDFPSGVWPHYAEESIFRLQMLGFVPVLAHPERYGWGSHQRSTPRDLVDRGVLIQVTLGSFVGTFGSGPQRIATELLDAGMVHLTATDAHSSGSRMRAAMRALDVLCKRYGDQCIDVTLRANPTALLRGEAIDVFVPSSRRSIWSGLDVRRLRPRSG